SGSPTSTTWRAARARASAGERGFSESRRSLSDRPMHIAREVVIDLHIDDVFDYVANPYNDPAWCEKVLYVEQVEGMGPGPGARYDVMHRPVRFRPPRHMSYTCLEYYPPVRIEWREDDGEDVIHVRYELEEVWTST